MRKLIALTLGALLAAAQACGPTREIVTGARESCTGSGSAGVCEGRFAKLSGTYDEVVQAPGCHTNVAVAVEVLASVESGSLRVLTIGPDAMEYTAEASPGRPASLTGAAAGCLNEFHVVFAAEQGEATGVKYTIRYNMP